MTIWMLRLRMRELTWKNIRNSWNWFDTNIIALNKIKIIYQHFYRRALFLLTYIDDVFPEVAFWNRLAGGGPGRLGVVIIPLMVWIGLTDSGGLSLSRPPTPLQSSDMNKGWTLLKVSWFQKDFLVANQWTNLTKNKTKQKKQIFLRIFVLASEKRSNQKSKYLV